MIYRDSFQPYGLVLQKFISTIHWINILTKTHMIIYIDAENAIDKI